MKTITRIAANGMKITSTDNSRMLDIALAKAAVAAERIANEQQARRRENYLRQRAYYECCLAMRASRGDTEAIAELAKDGLNFQMILNPNRETAPTVIAAQEVETALEVEDLSDGILGNTFVLGA